jgi:hypothetical protein
MQIKNLTINAYVHTIFGSDKIKAEKGLFDWCGGGK